MKGNSTSNSTLNSTSSTATAAAPASTAPTLASAPVTSTLSYLIGVPDQHLSPDVMDLDNNAAAKTVRSLSIIRNKLIQQNGLISRHIRNNLYGNIDEFIDDGIFDYLETQGIEILQAKPRVNDYIAKLNTLIPEKVGACRGLFPDWIEWTYIRRLFCMPSCIEKVVDKFHERKKSFPFGCYIAWPIYDPKAYPGGRQASGNILCDEKIFLRLLYSTNGAVLDERKNELREFLETAEKVVLAVDCENSDPYKLCAVMWELKKQDPELFAKIQKTMLFDDVHTTETWRILNDFLPVPVEHILTHRVNDHKSLVDIQLTAGVAREHYCENVDSFLIASSDSDFWGLIRSLPMAKFLLLAQEEKMGECLRKTLAENAIGYYPMDSFDTAAVRTAALEAGIRKKLEEIKIDVKGMITEQIEKMKITLSDEEMTTCAQMLQERMKVYLKDGTMQVVFAG